jgi:hypothetical protein
MEFTLKPGYLGMCSNMAANCQNDATHAEWLEFKQPLPTLKLKSGFEIPAATGIWQMVCDECCDKSARHEDK